MAGLLEESQTFSLLYPAFIGCRALGLWVDRWCALVAWEGRVGSASV